MENSEENEQLAAHDGKPEPKKPYTKPEVRHERVFETMALSCGKVGSTQSSCRFNKKNS